MVERSVDLLHWETIGQVSGNETGTSALQHSSESPVGFYRLTDSGATPHVVMRLDPVSPVSGYVNLTEGQTRYIYIGVVDIKSIGANSILRALNNLRVYSTYGTNDLSFTFASISLIAGDATYTTDIVGKGLSSTLLGGSYQWDVSFKDMAVPLPADVNVPINIVVEIAQQPEGTLSGTEVAAVVWSGNTSKDVNLVVTDIDQKELPVQSAKVTSSTVTLEDTNLVATDLSAESGPVIVKGNQEMANVTFKFTLTNVGHEDMFVSSDTEQSLDLSVLLGTADGLSSSLQLLGLNPLQFAGDTRAGQTTYYEVPPGSSRVFIVTGVLMSNGVYGPNAARISGIHYGPWPRNPNGYAITQGLDSLLVEVDF